MKELASSRFLPNEVSILPRAPYRWPGVDSSLDADLRCPGWAHNPPCCRSVTEVGASAA